MWRRDTPMDELRTGYEALRSARRSPPATLEQALRHPLWSRLVRLEGARARHRAAPCDLFSPRGPAAARGAHDMPLTADPFMPEPAVDLLPLPPELLPMAYRLADDYVVSDLEAFCDEVMVERQIWLDTTPMLDERLWCPTSRDMAAISIHYAVARGLVLRHPTQPHLLRRRVPA